MVDYITSGSSGSGGSSMEGGGTGFVSVSLNVHLKQHIAPARSGPSTSRITGLAEETVSRSRQCWLLG